MRGSILGAASCVAVFALGASGADAKVALKIYPKGPHVSAKLITNAKPVRIDVSLNGKGIGKLFRARPAAARPVPLGADDGLRPGRNKITAKVLLPSGKLRKRSRSFKISRRAPIPSAGPDVDAFGGDRIRLSAAKTKPGRGAAGSGKLRYRWKVVSDPVGSTPKLLGKSSARPKLLTDEPGVYRVRAQVRQGKGLARDDTVQIDATDPEVTRAGIFLSTTPYGPGAPDGAASGIEISSGSYAGFYVIGDNNPKGQVTTFFFDRATLGLTQAPVVTGVSSADATTLTSALTKAQQSTGRMPIVVSAGNGYGTVSPAFNTWLTSTLNAHGLNQATSFALAGTPPPKPTPGPELNGMHSVGPDIFAKGRLSGQLLPDAQNAWAFVPSTLTATDLPTVRFDTAVPGSGIELAGESYPAADPPAGCPTAGGFQVLVVGSAPPNLMKPVPITFSSGGDNYSNGDTFWTSDCSDADSYDQMLAMLTLLDDEIPRGNTDPPELVFVQSVGDIEPTPTGVDGGTALVNDLAFSLAGLGASPGAFLSAFDTTPTESTGYSLIGHNFANADMGSPITPAEHVTTEPNAPPPRLIGAMRYDVNGRLLPSIVTAASGARATAFNRPIIQSELVQQVNQSTYKPTPFPTPGGTAAQWQAALADMAAAIGLVYDPIDDVPCYRPPNGKADVRSNYCGGVPENANPTNYWTSTELPKVMGAPYESNPTYDSTLWTAVKDQLQTEFALVDDANTATADLTQAFTTAQATDVGDIVDSYVSTVQQAAAKQRQLELAADPTGLGWLADGLDLAAALGTFVSDGLSDALWIASSGTAVTGDIVTDATGAPLVTGFTGVLSGTPSEAASSVQEQMINQINAANTARFALSDAIVSDWGRLQQAPDDIQFIPDSEALQNAQSAMRMAKIRYTWSDMVRSSVSMNFLNGDNSPYQPPSPGGLDPAYDLEFADNFTCYWGDSFEEGQDQFYAGITAGSVYSDPFNRFAAGTEISSQPATLSVSGKNPSGDPVHPAGPSSQDDFVALFLPDSVLNGYFTPLPQPPINAVVNNTDPPGLGFQREQFMDRLGITNGRAVTCNN